jgi:hypothetical protein
MEGPMVSVCICEVERGEWKYFRSIEEGAAVFVLD